MKKEMDLSKPLFVFYIDVTGMNRSRAVAEIQQIQDSWSYSNTTTWIIPIKNSNSRVECLWDPTKDNSNTTMLQEIKGNFESGNFDMKKLKSFIRDWKLEKLDRG